MNLVCLIFLLCFFRSLILSQNYQNSQNYELNFVFFEIRDSSKANEKKGGKTQFFESECSNFQVHMQEKLEQTDPSSHGECSSMPHHTMKLNADNLNTKASQKKFTFSFLKSHISVSNLNSQCQAEDSEILAIKSYWRFGGYLPKDDAKKEIRRANHNKDHTPDFMDTLRIAGYLYFNEPVPDKEKYEIKHELLGLCTSCVNLKANSTTYHHYIIDRNANAELPEIWNTKIRVIYIGEGESCMKNDTAWAEKRTKGLNLRDESYGLNYTMNMILKDLRGYFKEFPKYNALYNCQHFANNLYNKITGKNKEFISKDVMVLKERGGATNEQKLLFDFT